MMNNTTVFCVVCNKYLRGKKEKYCSDRCRRQNKKQELYPTKECIICTKKFSPSSLKVQTCGLSCGGVLSNINRRDKVKKQMEKHHEFEEFYKKTEKE